VEKFRSLASSCLDAEMMNGLTELVMGIDGVEDMSASFKEALSVRA